MAEDYARYEGKMPLKDLLAKFGKHLLQATAWAYKTAAGNGIDQALALIEDPEYFETVKRRRQLDLERQRKHDDEQKEARLKAKMDLSRVPKKSDGEPWAQ